MNTGILGLTAGVLAFILSIVDAVLTGRLVDRVAKAHPVDSLPAGETPAGPVEDPEMRDLRTAINVLNSELLSLLAGPVTTREQLAKIVVAHFEVRRRREAVEKFVTRKKEIRLLAKDWAKVISTAFKFSQQDSATAAAIMQRLTDDWLSLAARTGGEANLESEIEALLSRADQELLALIPETERKRFRPIPRGWSSGLVGDATDK